MLVRRTANATRDDLGSQDYLEIYQEVRQYDEEADRYRVSLRKFVELVDSQYSHAFWGKFDKGEVELTRGMRQELRSAVGLDPLPLTVEEAMRDVSPDAEVYQMGEDEMGFVLLASLPDGRKLVERRRKPKQKRRRKYVRPCATPEQDVRREALGAEWADVIEAGLKALEK